MKFMKVINLNYLLKTINSSKGDVFAFGLIESLLRMFQLTEDSNKGQPFALGIRLSAPRL